jgi:hypothetical protein
MSVHIARWPVPCIFHDHAALDAVGWRRGSADDPRAHRRVDAFVWIESWQQQCCGDDFRVGSVVRWQVRTNSDVDEWVELLLGAEWSAKGPVHGGPPYGRRR